MYRLLFILAATVALLSPRHATAEETLILLTSDRDACIADNEHGNNHPVQYTDEVFKPDYTRPMGIWKEMYVTTNVPVGDVTAIRRANAAGTDYVMLDALAQTGTGYKPALIWRASDATNLESAGSYSLTFRTQYGDIKSIRIWVTTPINHNNAFDQVNAGYANAFTSVSNCMTPASESILVNGTTVSNVVWNINPIDPSEPIEVRMPGLVANHAMRIKRIEVTWEPNDGFPPAAAPVLTQSSSELFDWTAPAAGGSVYRAGTYRFTRDALATPYVKSANDYCWTVADAASLTADAYSEASSTDPADAKTKWIKGPIMPYAAAPANNDPAFGDSFNYTVRVIGVNDFGPGPEARLEVTVHRPGLPELDIERTTSAYSGTDGQHWEAPSATLTYTSNNPCLYFTGDATSNGRDYCWSFNQMPSESDFSHQSAMPSPASPWAGMSMPDIAEGYTTYMWLYVRQATLDATGADTYYTDRTSAFGTPYSIRLVKRAGVTGLLGAPALAVSADGPFLREDNGTIVFISEMAHVSIESSMPGTGNPSFQYQFRDDYSQAPDEARWETLTTSRLNVDRSGRLFVRQTLTPELISQGYMQAGINSVDLRRINTFTTDLGLENVADEQVITLSDPSGFVLMGAYNTVKRTSTSNEPDTKFIYIADNRQRAIKLVIEGNDNNETVRSYLASAAVGQGLNGITGVIRGIESNLPELWITTSAMDYSAFLPGLDANTSLSQVITEADRVERAHFNRKVALRGMTYNGADNTFITASGETVKTYSRLLTYPDYTTILSLTDGVRYTLEGFVGYANGEMVLLPTGAVKVPGLRAPNPITPNATDLEYGYITVNVITDNFTVHPDTKGVRDGTQCIYSINSNPSSQFDLYAASSPAITITKDDFFEGVCELSVRYARQNIQSQPVTVMFVLHEAPGLGSIADFKDLYLDRSDIADPADPAQENRVEYHRYIGRAEVRAITPRYLYLRDIQPEGEPPYTVAQKSARSLLLYNDNGWEAPVALAERAGGEPRKLQPGDVITNFALIADHTELGNLRGYATGFSRTVQLLNPDPLTPEELSGDAWQPVEKNADDPDVAPFGEADRMVRYIVRNVKVIRTDGDTSLPETDPVRYVYTLDMTGYPTLNINHVFEVSQGWGTVYDSQTLYDIEGVVLRDGEDQATGNPKYALAFVGFSVKDASAAGAPVLTLKGDGAAGTQFLAKATLTMELPAGVDPDNATIWYTLDGSDPMQASSATRARYTGPITLTANTLVKAFVAVKGGLPGATVEQIYTRRANDRRYIVNLLDQAQEGVPYHFTGTSRIVAKGGEYIFVRGTQGHYLPIHIDPSAGIDLTREAVGNYLTDIVVEPHIIDANGSRIVRGAHVTAEYAEAYTYSTAQAPGALDADITLEPDVVTTLTARNARRYVRIEGVKLIGSEFEAEDDAAAYDTRWTLITEKGDPDKGVEIAVNHDILQPEFNWDETDQSRAAYYNITGFAMLGEDGQIELWPLHVEKVKASAPVTARFGENIISDPVTTADGLTTLEFYPLTSVRLRVDGIADQKEVTIHYYITDIDDHAIPADARWNVYSQEFLVNRSCRIAMYATAEGYAPSAPTYVEMTLGKPAGTVDFSVASEPGKTTVTMTAAEGAEIYWTADAEGAGEQWAKYAAPVEFTQAASIRAYAMEGKKKGAVSSMYVMVLAGQDEPSTPVEPGDETKRSGAVEFSWVADTDGVPVVTITPADKSITAYSIYYTVDSRKQLTETPECLYTGSFRLEEGGIVMAMLVEEGKKAGHAQEVHIWYVPTSTGDTSADSATADDAVTAEGDTILAPAGSEAYDLTGRRVAMSGLRAGVYIVRLPGGKAVKVSVR